MTRFFRKLIFALLRYSGIPFIVRELVQRRKVTIVVFHAPSANAARSHFQALRSRYRVIALADYLRVRTNVTPQKLPPKSLIITIDDGHRSNIELKSMLEELRVPVTIYLCSGVVGTNRHYWWTHTHSAAEAEACKQMEDAERLRFLLNRDYSPDKEFPDRQALSRGEIEELKPWVDFQAHTVTHPILPACSAEQAEQELRRCKAVLENEFGLIIQGLAYPNGDYSSREVSLARSAGYNYTVTLDRGFNDLHTDLFRLRRIALPDDASANELLVKTSGLWDILRPIGVPVKRLAARCGWGLRKNGAYDTSKNNLHEKPRA